MLRFLFGKLGYIPIHMMASDESKEWLFSTLPIKCVTQSVSVHKVTVKWTEDRRILLTFFFLLLLRRQLSVRAQILTP